MQAKKLPKQAIISIKFSNFRLGNCHKVNCVRLRQKKFKTRHIFLDKGETEKSYLKNILGKEQCHTHFRLVTNENTKAPISSL